MWCLYKRSAENYHDFTTSRKNSCDYSALVTEIFVFLSWACTLFRSLDREYWVKKGTNLAPSVTAFANYQQLSAIWWTQLTHNIKLCIKLQSFCHNWVLTIACICFYRDLACMPPLQAYSTPGLSQSDSCHYYDIVLLILFNSQQTRCWRVPNDSRASAEELKGVLTGIVKMESYVNVINTILNTSESLQNNSVTLTLFATILQQVINDTYTWVCYEWLCIEA